MARRRPYLPWSKPDSTLYQYDLSQILLRLLRYCNKRSLYHNLQIVRKVFCPHYGVQGVNLWVCVCVCMLKTGVAVNSVKTQYAAGGLRLDSWTVSAAMESWWNWACAKRWLFFSYWNSFTIIGIWRFYCFLLFSSWVLHVESSLPPVRWAALLIAWLQSGPPGQNVHTPVEAKVRSITDT